MSGISGTANEITVVHSAGEGSSATVSLPDDVVIGNNLTVTNDLNVTGDIVLSGSTVLAAHEFKLGDGTTGTPVQNGIISIDRGTSDSAQLVWNESLDRWQAGTTNDMQLVALENDSASFTTLSVDNNLTVAGNTVARGDLDVTGDLTVASDLSITGNLQVNGTTTTIDTTTLLIEDNIITLNKNQTGTPSTTLRSGIEVERGSATNAVFQFNENTDQWEFTGPKSGTLAVTDDINNGTITITAGTDLVTGGNFSLNDSDNTTVTIDHATIARTNNTSTAAPGYGATFTAIDSITTNTRGHITAVNTKTVTIPASDNTDIDTWVANSSSVAGYVASGSGQDSKVWKTDSSGVPAWRNDANTTYSTATSSALGLVKIGYTESGKNYPVELSSGKMYVNVPWVDTDTNTTYSAGNDLDLSGTQFSIESTLNHVTEITNTGNFSLTPQGELNLQSGNATAAQPISLKAHLGTQTNVDQGFGEATYNGVTLQVGVPSASAQYPSRQPQFILMQDAGFTANSNTNLGKVSWLAPDFLSPSNTTEWASIQANMSNGTASQEATKISIKVAKPGSPITVFEADGHLTNLGTILRSRQGSTVTIATDIELEANGGSAGSVTFGSNTDLDISTAANSTSLVIYNSAGTAVKTIYGTTG